MSSNTPATSKIVLICGETRDHGKAQKFSRAVLEQQ